MAAPLTPERRQKLEARAAWLDESVARLRRDWSRSPRLLWLVFLALPVGFIWNVFFALVIVGVVGALVGVTIYVAWSHLHENEVELKSIRAELAKSPQEIAPGDAP